MSAGSRYVESRKVMEDDVSFKIIREQYNTYETPLVLCAIDNGYVIDGAIGMRHYATPEALRAGLAKICDRFVEEVTKHREKVAEDVSKRHERVLAAEIEQQRFEAVCEQVEDLKKQVAALRTLAAEKGLVIP